MPKVDQVMTPEDWFQMIEAAELGKFVVLPPRLGFYTNTMLSEGAVRSTEGRCPLCALAYKQVPEVSYKEAFASALCYAFNLDAINDAAREVAAAYDNPTHPLRARALRAVGLEVNR